MLCSVLAKHFKARFWGEDANVESLAHVRIAGPHMLAPVVWLQDVKLAKKSQASCLLMEESVAALHADQMNTSIIVVGNLAAIWHQLGLLFPRASDDSIHIGRDSFIHSQACIEPDVEIGSRCFIGPFAVVHSGTKIGDGVQIGAGTVIGGPAFVPSFSEGREIMLPCWGYVRIADHVRIGAHCTVDRGLIGSTNIGMECKIDNMVHIGHDVHLGARVIIAAQTGIAGCVFVEEGVTIGGQVGIAPHIYIGKGARISAKSGLHCDVRAHEVWSGNPALLHGQYLRSHAWMKRQMEKYSERYRKSAPLP